MSKNLKKLLSLSIASIITFASVIQIPVSADTSKPVLSLERVINKAIDNSYQIVLNEQKQDMLGEKEDFYKDINMDDDGYNDIQMDQNDQKKRFLKDQISSDITNKYNSIILLEKDVQNANKNIEVKSKDYETMQLKNKVGLVNNTDIQNAKAELDKIKIDEKSKEEELKNNKAVISILTGINVENYIFENEIKFEPLKVESLDSYVDERIDNYFRYNKKLAKWVEDNYNDTANSKPTAPDKNDAKYIEKDENGKFKYNFDSDLIKWRVEYQNWIANSLKDIESEYNANTAVDSVNDGKRIMKQTLLTTYTKLVALEGNITSMKDQIDLLDNKINMSKLQYELGLITKQEYDKQILAKEQLEINYDSLINNYNDLKEKIDKPWILSSGK